MPSDDISNIKKGVQFKQTDGGNKKTIEKKRNVTQDLQYKY
jgi:hypothetical protein